MIFGEVLQRFVEDSPVCVMARIALEQALAPQRLDALFQRCAVSQYTWELLFSTVVDVMSLVVCRVSPSVRAVYMKRPEQIGVSLKALYEKLSHIEPATSRELVRQTGAQVTTVIRQMKGECAPLLPGYRCRILDGNHLGGTEHRLEVLRETNAGALPGLALSVLDPQVMVISDIIPCEDAHTQECTLLDTVLETVQPRDVWIADRNFCTSFFLFGLARRQAFFVIRQHAGHLVWRTQGTRRFVGRGRTGRVYEQEVILTDPDTGEELRVRRITVRLNRPTRDNETEIHILSSLPEEIDALTIAEVYAKRWTLETAFQELTTHLKCELNTLGYPPAALFGFCVAAACYNVLAAVKGALRSVHGEEKVREDVSNYYLVEEIGATYRGMMIAVPPEQWEPFRHLGPVGFARILRQLAQSVQLSAYPKRHWGPKKPARKRQKAPRQHVATARLLENHKLRPTNSG